jgi:hypothetical protein
MPDEVTPDLTPAEVTAQRQEFLSNPPAEISVEPEVTPDAGADEAAAIEEFQAAQRAAADQPPAGPEGAAPAPTPAPVPSGDPYAQWGGEEAVRTAMAVQDALRTENGLRALVANGLTELGYSVEAVRTALDSFVEPQAQQRQGPPDPFADFGDDDPVTVGQAKQLAQSVAEQAVAQALAAQQETLAPMQRVIADQQQTQVRNVTDAAVIELLGAIPTEPDKLASYQRQVDAIVERGARYYDPNQWSNPAHVRAAVVQAHAELEGENLARFNDFLARRREVRDSQPPNIGGGAGTDGPLAEPKTMAEARKQAEAAGFFA